MVSSQTLVPSRLLLVAAVLGGCIVVGQSVCMYADAVVHTTPTLVTASTRPARAGCTFFFLPKARLRCVRWQHSGIARAR